MSLDMLIKELNKRITIGPFNIYVKRINRGRFSEERNIELYVKYGNYETRLLYLKIFNGRPPYYKPWIEVFGINKLIKLNKIEILYFNSCIEHNIILLLSNAISSLNGKLFIEYLNDDETRYQLEMGVPIPATRLGYKLFSIGFTWFKDWYFPEGFLEGNQKLQAERPYRREIIEGHLRNIRNEILVFLNKYYTYSKNIFILYALKRARLILRRIEEIRYDRDII